jgi:membrane-bound lytic murein transglycosylase D
LAQLKVWLRGLAAGLLTAALFAAPAGAGEPFDRPAELEPDIAFWRNVFASIDSSQAYLHDSRHLNVVYETVAIPAGASDRDRRRIADQRRDYYRAQLKKLATTPAADRTPELARIAALWPAATAAAEFTAAAQRIRFQQGLADRFRAGLQRAGAWQPYIKAQLEAQGVPVGLAALPHVESSFNPEARSHVGAAGLWQFTRGTGQRFMTIDNVVDERRDPFRSSESAAQLLAYNYSILQSWPLAITAYNHGVGGMRRAVKQLGTTDIAAINRRYKGRTFGFASRNFYVAFLAAHEVEQNAAEYFGTVPRNAPEEPRYLQLTRYVPAREIAAAAGTSLAELRSSNPALLAPVWDGTKHVPRNYRVRLPASITASADDIAARIPRGVMFAAQTPDQYHKVQRGESLSVIAARYSASVSELVALNGLQSRHRIRVGQVLRLPYAGVAIAPGSDTYKVQAGDSLSRIAQRAGVSQAQLLALNNLSSPDRIFVGQQLYLRAAATPVTAPAPAAAASAAPAAAVAADAAPAAGSGSAARALAATAAGSAPVAGSATRWEPAEPMQASAADPSNYDISAAGVVEIQDGETLGHLADWLNIRTQRLRDLNGLQFGEPVAVGRQIRLDLSATSPETFTARRIAWHREVQDAFFVNYKVTATTEHKVKSGESLWVLTNKRYKVPVWLLRQYNPDVDFESVRAGTRIIFPRIEPVEREA